MKPIVTHCLGFSDDHSERTVQHVVDGYWDGTLSRDAVDRVGSELRRRAWAKQTSSGIDWAASGDFTFCDRVLDTSCMVGNVPSRFGWNGNEADLDLRLLMSRGGRPGHVGCCENGVLASGTAPWFDEQHRYTVPEFDPETQFTLASSQVLKDYNEAGLLGVTTKPVLLGPVSYLTLGVERAGTSPQFSRFALFDRLLPVYAEVLKRFTQWGAEWVQIDEPILASELTSEQRQLLRKCYQRLKNHVPRLKLLVASYFELGDNLELACSLACDGLHIDAQSAPYEVDIVAERLPKDRILSLGIVDGRLAQVNDFESSLRTIAAVRSARSDSELWLAPSCSLVHAPAVSGSGPDVSSSEPARVVSAEGKLVEVNVLRDLAEGRDRAVAWASNRAAWGVCAPQTKEGARGNSRLLSGHHSLNHE